jgi:hypothetical protein
LLKIAENCDHNIDPWSKWFAPIHSNYNSEIF